MINDLRSRLSREDLRNVGAGYHSYTLPLVASMFSQIWLRSACIQSSETPAVNEAMLAVYGRNMEVRTHQLMFHMHGSKRAFQLASF